MLFLSDSVSELYDLFFDKVYVIYIDVREGVWCVLKSAAEFLAVPEAVRRAAAAAAAATSDSSVRLNKTFLLRKTSLFSKHLTLVQRSILGARQVSRSQK